MRPIDPTLPPGKRLQARLAELAADPRARLLPELAAALTDLRFHLIDYDHLAARVAALEREVHNCDD